MIIDVSSHQGNINWEQVKTDKSFLGAILRCGYGNDAKNQDDAKFAANAEACIKLGIPFGAYLYSYAKSQSDIKSEVAHTLRLLKPYKNNLSYPVYFDSEQNGTQNYAKSAAAYYCAALSDAGYKAGIYASRSWYNAYLKDIKGYSKWIAAWGTIKPQIEGMDLWQYTDKGHIAGISGNVDMSYSYFSKLQYRAHVQTVGWMPWVNAGQIAGTTGQSKRLEAVQFSKNSGITAQAHCQSYGDMKPVAAGGVCGTTGEGKRMEAIKLDCDVPIIYRAHVQGIGWMPWVANGMWTGTKGESKRMEAIQVEYAG